MGRACYVIADVATLVESTGVLASAAVAAPDPPEKGGMMRALASYYTHVPADRGRYAVMGSWELV